MSQLFRSLLAGLLLTGVAWGQQTTVIDNVKVGQICRIKSAAGPVTFMVAYPAIWDLWQPVDDECAIATDRAGEVVLIGSYLPKEGETRPRIDRWVVRISPGPGPQPPSPPGPGPSPPAPPTPPTPPTPVPPDSWQEQVSAMTRKLPADALTLVPQVVGVFTAIASRCGQDLFTGPEIRAALETQLNSLDGFAGRWNVWAATHRELTAKWANEKYRDSAAYKERLEATARGLQAVQPAVVSSAPIVLEGVRVLMIPNRHQIRGDRLYEYRCPMNGKRCSWVEVGRVMERGAGWVIVQ